MRKIQPNLLRESAATRRRSTMEEEELGRTLRSMRHRTPRRLENLASALDSCEEGGVWSNAEEGGIGQCLFDCLEKELGVKLSGKQNQMVKESEKLRFWKEENNFIWSKGRKEENLRRISCAFFSFSFFDSFFFLLLVEEHFACVIYFELKFIFALLHLNKIKRLGRRDEQKFD